MQGSERQKPPLHPSREGSRLQTAPAPRRAVYRVGRMLRAAASRPGGGSTGRGSSKPGRHPRQARKDPHPIGAIYFGHACMVQRWFPLDGLADGWHHPGGKTAWVFRSTRVAGYRVVYVGGAFHRNAVPPGQSSHFGHVYTDGYRVVYVSRSPGDMTYPTCVTRQHVHTVGDRGFCQTFTGGWRPPSGLSGSPRPSRGCLPGPQEAGSTMPRPPEREPGLRLR